MASKSSSFDTPESADMEQQQGPQTAYRGYGSAIRNLAQAVPQGKPDIRNANVWGSNGYDYAQKAIDRYLFDQATAQKRGGIEPVVGNSFALDSGYADKGTVPIYYPGIKNDPIAETAYAERRGSLSDVLKFLLDVNVPEMSYYADESKSPLQRKPINGK